jgi:hypothetical protein
MKTFVILAVAIATIGCNTSRGPASTDYAAVETYTGKRCVTKHKWLDCNTGRTMAETRGGSAD